MSCLRTVLVLVCLSFMWLGLCNAKPAKASKFSQPKPKSSSTFLDILGKRGHKKCDDLLGSEIDLKAFTDEVAYAFFSTGNIQGLDELLKYLVDSECFSLEETIHFRRQLVTIYDLIHKQNVRRELVGKFYKRDSTTQGFDYYNHLNSLIDELSYAYKNGNTKSVDLIKYMVEYILTLEESHQLETKQSNLLLEKIKDLVSLRAESLLSPASLNDEKIIEQKLSNNNKSESERLEN